MATQKAGCYLVNKEKRSIAIIYRDKQKDYSFPKGHLEDGEDLKTCAIRETAEETKWDCKIVEDISPTIEKYTTPKGEECECYMYTAIDLGKSDNDSLDTHYTYWVDIDKVESTLSYDGLKREWNKVKDIIKEKLLDKE